jgi:hypothetical protein
MPLTPQQESEIYPLLDSVLELPVGKAILHKCTLQRANYLTRIIQGLRYDLAIESLATYDDTSPFYGKGVYANIWVEPHARGLLITTLANPADTTMWRIIQCRATKEAQQLETTVAAARQRLSRAQKKYPKIMGMLWVIGGKPPMVCYPQKEKEQIIVDIDINPVGNISAPTQEEIAKANI